MVFVAPRNNARSPRESAVTQTLTRRSFWRVFHSERARLRSTVRVHPPPQASACEGGLLQSSDSQKCPTSLLDYKLWSSFFPARTCEHRVGTQRRAFQTRLQRCSPFSHRFAEPCQPNYWLLSRSYLHFTHGKWRTFLLSAQNYAVMRSGNFSALVT